jgi:hypothetical protein
LGLVPGEEPAAHLIMVIWARASERPDRWALVTVEVATVAVV